MPNPPFPSEPNRLAAIADAARRLPAPEPAAASLDAAWAEAEAALPEGWAGPILSPLKMGWWEAGAWVPGDEWHLDRLSVRCQESTPAAALRALAAALRERGR